MTGGSISGTAVRNTKVYSMVASGKQKMSEEWFAILDIPDYIEKYTRISTFKEDLLWNTIIF